MNRYHFWECEVDFHYAFGIFRLDGLSCVSFNEQKQIKLITFERFRNDINKNESWSESFDAMQWERCEVEWNETIGRTIMMLDEWEWGENDSRLRRQITWESRMNDAHSSSSSSFSTRSLRPDDGERRQTAFSLLFVFHLHHHNSYH